MMRSIDTLVCGAGVSGLAYAFRRDPEADLLVVDSRDEPGGLVRTEHADGPPRLRCELGPEALTGGSPVVDTLARELGLELRALAGETRRRYLMRAGRLVAVPTSPRALLSTPLLTARGKLRLLTEPLRAPRRALDGSVADFARHRLGPEVLAQLVDPLVSGIHAGDPEELSLKCAFPALHRMASEHGSLLRAMARRRRSSPRGRPAIPSGLLKPGGGMQALAERLAVAIGPRLELGCELTSLEAVEGGFRATTSEGAVAARRVVLALPLRAAARLLARAAPSAARALADMRCESLASVHHAYRRQDVGHPLDGFGYLVPAREGKLHLGTLFSSTIDPESCEPDHVLLRTLVGGARHPELVRGSDAELSSLVAREVRPPLGVAGEPLAIRIARYTDVLPRYDLGHEARLAALEAALPAGLSVLGNFTRGIGLPALIERADELARAHGERTAEPVPRSSVGSGVPAGGDQRAVVDETVGEGMVGR